ncbi:MAG: S-adenosylmethionine decarboxylase [Gemmatimonadales bacterium]|nr:S-adenosylmethionine decarboxylase [Gemmatimonadales bacterium]
MASVFNHVAWELTELEPSRLRDADGLSAMVVAAASAIGMPALGPPVVREAPNGVVVGMLCRDGHIVLHSAPADGICFVDIAARAPTEVERGLDVIVRRLGSLSP